MIKRVCDVCGKDMVDYTKLNPTHGYVLKKVIKTQTTNCEIADIDVCDGCMVNIISYISDKIGTQE